MQAIFKVEQAGPLVSVQDVGRFGYMRFGVTESGPMDPLSFSLAQSGLGVPSESAAIEISLGGLVLQCIEGAVTCCVAGGHFDVLLDGRALPPWSLFTVSAGSTLKVRPGPWGSWCYLAFLGELETPEWLGSRSVHLASGLCGAVLLQGDEVRVRDARADPDSSGELLDPTALKSSGTARVVMGPQDQFFKTESVEEFLNSSFELTSDYNRMGVRLSGPKLAINAALDMPSSPITRGSIQVPGHGDPICLLADHQTTGGYPKIATVISADLPDLVQMRAGDCVRFEAVGAMDAVTAARKLEERRVELVGEIAESRTSLVHKLWNSNLVSGVV